MPPSCLYHLCLPTEDSSDEENTPVLNRFTRKFAIRINTLMLIECFLFLHILFFDRNIVSFIYNLNFQEEPMIRSPQGQILLGNFNAHIANVEETWRRVIRRDQ